MPRVYTPLFVDLNSCWQNVLISQQHLLSCDPFIYVVCKLRDANIPLFFVHFLYSIEKKKLREATQEIYYFTLIASPYVK